MSSFGEFTDLNVELMDNYVAVAEIQRPPNNFFDEVLINAIADAFEALDADKRCRAIVLAAAGKNFCAGADFSASARQGQSNTNAGELYRQAVRLFRTRKPVIGAIQGAAVGGGLGLAMVPDFRVACEESRFSANFSRLGFHPGFGLTVTLPELIGTNAANFMFFSGRRVKGAEAYEMGLADAFVPLDEVRSKAIDMASEIAISAPLAVESVRATMRVGLADRVAIATDHELAEQNWLRGTEDFKEGIKAMAERRAPDFQGE
jgi:enoyl-CoA hydratase/carnithine racemase